MATQITLQLIWCAVRVRATYALRAIREREPGLASFGSGKCLLYLRNGFGAWVARIGYAATHLRIGFYIF